MPKPVKAACYCRVSTSKESQLDSLDKQHEFFRIFFENHPEYELFRLYTDEGISAKSMKNRAAFLSMIRDAQQRRFEVIFVKDVSRFARNARDFFNTLDCVRRAGVRINFITLDMTSEPANEFMLGLLALVAQEESANLSKKTKFGKNITAAKGRVPNFVFGYDRVDNYTLAVNDVEAGWVRRIFSMYTSEGLGTAKIAEYLNQNGVMSKKGNIGAWTQHVVCRMLKNELYIGNVINKKSEVIDFREGTRRTRPQGEQCVVMRPEFRIIDDEVFESAREIMQARNDAFATKHRRFSGKYPLSNLLACAGDGYSFRRCVRQYAAGAKKYVFWTCSHRNAKGASSCENALRVDEADMLAVLYAFLCSAVNDRERLVSAVTGYVLDELNAREAGRVDSGELRHERRLLEARLERYAELYAEGLTTKDSVMKKLAPLNARRADIDEALNLSSIAQRARADIEAQVRMFLLDEAGPHLLTNIFLRSLFGRILVYGDGRLQAYMRQPDAMDELEIPLAIAAPAK